MQLCRLINLIKLLQDIIRLRELLSSEPNVTAIFASGGKREAN